MLDKNTLELIKQLSIEDTKTLEQKGLKVAEEVGELAKKLLPYTNAFATNHRFITKTQILEELSDVTLCVLSILYDMNFSPEEFQSMIHHKALKWAELQENEKSVGYPLPYEIHITVHEADIDQFKQTCKSLGVKPVLLDLHTNQRIIKDSMTSSVFMGDDSTVMQELIRISSGLMYAGFNVVREKIETVPWHPAAPKKSNPVTMPKDCYFETHFGVITKTTELIKLAELAKSLDCHMSRNVFKRHDDDTVTIMLTHRRYNGMREEFDQIVTQTKELLISNGYHVDKLITEFSIYDTKVSHDSEWLSKR